MTSASQAAEDIHNMSLENQELRSVVVAHWALPGWYNARDVNSVRQAMLCDQATRVNDVLEVKGIRINVSMLTVQDVWNALGSRCSSTGLRS